MNTTPYAAALNASAARLAHVNQVLRPKLLTAQAVAGALNDQDSLEASIAWAEVEGIQAAITSMQADAKKYTEYAEELRGEADL